MTSKFKLLAVISLLIAAAGVSNVFVGGDDVWQPVARESIRSRNRRAIDGNKFLVYRFNDAAAKAILSKAPMEFSADAQTHTFVFQLPMPDGKFESLRVVEWAEQGIAPPFFYSTLKYFACG